MTGIDPNDVAITPAQNLPALLALDYDHFVECAYLTILNRPADTDALEHYVERLRAGHSKLAILSALYGSDEARAANVRIPWLRNAIRRSKFANLPLVRLAFNSDRRDVRLQFEHRLHVVEKQLALLTTQSAALVRNLGEISGALRHIAKASEATRQQITASDNSSEVLSSESLVARRVYQALSDAIADETGDVARSG